MLASRGGKYATDADAFKAVIADPSLIIVDDMFLQDGGGPKSQSPESGDRVTMINGAGQRHEMR